MVYKPNLNIIVCYIDRTSSNKFQSFLFYHKFKLHMKIQSFYLILCTLLVLSYSLKHQQTDNNTLLTNPVPDNSAPQPTTDSTSNNIPTSTADTSSNTTSIPTQPSTNTTPVDSSNTTTQSPSQSNVNTNNSGQPSTQQNKNTVQNTTKPANSQTNKTQQTTPTQSANNQTKPEQPANNQTNPAQPANNQTTPTQPTNNQTKPTQPENNQTKPTQPENNQTKPTQPENNQTKPIQPENNQKTEQQKKEQQKKQAQRVQALNKQEADRVAKQQEAAKKRQQEQQKQLQGLKSQIQKRLKQIQEELAKTYEPKPEDKQQLTKNINDLSSSTKDLQTKLQSRLVKVTTQSSHHHHEMASTLLLHQKDVLHLLSVSSTQCYNLTSDDEKTINETITQLQANLTKLKIFLDKAKADPSLASQQEVQNLQKSYDDTLARLTQLKAIKKCTPQQVSNTQPSKVSLPTGLGISEAQSYFKNISNLNAPNWILGNQTIDQYTDKLFNFLTHNNVTKCPLETPYVRKSDNQCINCTDPNPIFDLYSGECVACPTGTQLNKQTHKCDSTSTPTPSPSKCKANYVWNQAQQKCVCPQNFPIDLGCQCVTCLEPFVWNINQKACKLRCQESHVWNKDKQVCQCPASTPYEVNGQCIACNLPFQWQASSNTCSLKVNNCAAPSPQPQPSPQPNPSIPVVPTTPTQCSSNYVFDNNVQKCICPTNLPFNDGTKCVSCDLPQYWDHDLKRCLYCPDFKYFSTITRNCEPCPAERPLFRNHVCEACAPGTTYDASTNSCTSGDSFIEPAITNKIPVTTTVPSY